MWPHCMQGYHSVSMHQIASAIARSARSLALLAALLGSSVSPAAAATTEIGAVTEIRAGDLPAPITTGGFTVQVEEESGSYAVPPGYSTITAWRHSAGTTAGALTFKVYRPTGALREFVAVASDTRAITPGTVHTFPVRIAVQAGDRIGLSSDDVELAYESFLLTDKIGFFSFDVPPGVTRATDGEPFPDFKLDVSATLAADPDAPPAAGGPATPGASYALPSPTLQRLSLKPSVFAAARTGASTRTARRRGFGTKVGYRVDMPAAVRFKVQRVLAGRRSGRGGAARCVAPTRRNRRAARCSRFVPVPGSFSHASRGTGSFYFTGRIAGRRLARGSYRLMATATASGLTGNSLSRRFRIRR